MWPFKKKTPEVKTAKTVEAVPRNWQRVFVCSKCGHIDTARLEVCPKCGEDYYPFRHAVGRPWGFVGAAGYYFITERWELKQKA